MNMMHLQELVSLQKTKSLRIIAVSKKQSLQKIQSAITQGFFSFGENYLQEALPKMQYFKENKRLQWHFIGKVQSNKTEKIANHFDWVQSVDRQDIAERLNNQRDPALTALNVCIQLNLSSYPHQGGIKEASLPALVDVILKLPRLKLRGLMTIVTRDYEKVAQIYYRLKKSGIDIDTLSMGMSQDYKIALEKGANMIRLGTLIFGERK